MLRKIPLFLLIFLLMICLGGCAGGGGGDDAGLPDGEEIQTGDDGGTPGDDGGTPGDDATEIPVELTLEPINSWQRGPVRVYFSISGPGGQAVDLRFDYSTDGQTFLPATVLSGYQPDITLDPAGAPGVFVWDSKSDVATDEAAVTIRGTPSVGNTNYDPATTGPFELLNAPDRDRPVVVAHPYDANSNPGTLASVLMLRSDGTLEDTGVDLACGLAPALAAFTKDGRFGVVLGEGPGHNQHNLAPFAVDRTGTLTRVGGVINIRDLGFSGADLAPAPDGSGIWLVHRTGEGGLFFLSFEGAEPHVRPAEPSGYNLFPITLPASMAILPDNRRAVISGGALSIDDPPYDITLVDLFSGTILDQQVMGVGSMADKTAVTSDGTRALIPSADPWGAGNHQVMVVSLGSDSVLSWHGVAVPYPSWVAIHPGDGAALVTSWDDDSVTVLDLSADPPVATQTIPGVPLADHLDCVQEGSLAGLCLVSAVTDLAIIALENDGTVSLSPPFAFGDGVENITTGPAIFP
ncbi:hypothetical protein ACFL2F_03735 [Myxococcota bacterium]